MPVKVNNTPKNNINFIDLLVFRECVGIYTDALCTYVFYDYLVQQELTV